MAHDLDIKAIIGLGNSGPKYERTRHNIGFRIVDQLAQRYGSSWQKKGIMEIAPIMIGDTKILLVKPQTFMNNSGNVIPLLAKQGIKAENILVVHDELEKPFGNLSFRIGGSARGHNGLRSLIQACGPDFARLRFGIGRPEQKEEVGDYVLRNFLPAEQQELERLIDDAADMIEQEIKK